MKIAGVTLCFNESNMIKYVMPYWDRIKPDKLIVYDNMSTDNTVELLKQYPYVEVRTFDTGGKFCDKTNSKIKTETCAELKKAGYDWIYSGDFDEVIYSFNPDFRAELKKIEDLGGNVFVRDLVHPFSPEPYEFDETKLIHEQLTHFLTWHDYTNKWGGSKTILHKGDGIAKIRYADGQHSCSLKSNGTEIKLFGYPFIAFHLKFVDFGSLEKNSHLKHERIQWRTVEPNASVVTISHLRKHYAETCGKEKILEKIEYLLKKCDRIKDWTWEDFLKRYNSELFLVSSVKFKKDENIKSLDYSNLNLTQFI